MVITDSPAPRETRTARNFAIMTHHDPADWKTQVLKN